jgi:acyl dehydratase
VTDKGRHATYTVEVEADTPDGEPICTQRGVMFVRGGGSGADKPRSEKPAPPSRGEVVAKFTQHVDEAMPPQYSAASGDRNPIHLDDAVAQLVGLPGVINHGLGTLSLVMGGIVEHTLDGDPEKARRISVRFTDIVIPGTDLDTTVWEGDDAIVFETTRPDGTVVVTGTVAS